MPSSLEQKLRQIITDEQEYERIKCEIQRSPEKHISLEFLDLYKELTEESDEIDSRKLSDNDADD